jgi:hypothetical protein
MVCLFYCFCVSVVSCCYYCFDLCVCVQQVFVRWHNQFKIFFTCSAKQAAPTSAVPTSPSNAPSQPANNGSNNDDGGGHDDDDDDDDEPVTDEEKANYTAIFDRADTDKDGFVSGTIGFVVVVVAVQLCMVYLYRRA